MHVEQWGLRRLGLPADGGFGRGGHTERLRLWWAHGCKRLCRQTEVGGTVPLNCSQGGRQHCKSRSLGRRSVLHASAGWQVVASFRVPKLEFPISKTHFRNSKKEYPTIKSEYTKLQEHYQLLGGHIKRYFFAQNMFFS